MKYVKILLRNGIDTLKQSLSEQSDDSITTNFMHFERVALNTKADKKVKHLKAVSTPVNISYLLRYISEKLTKFIHHRNKLPHYKSFIKTFKEHFDTVSLDTDFSQNFSIPVKSETQLLQWSHSHTTVHSSNLKNYGEKSYHPYP